MSKVVGILGFYILSIIFLIVGNSFSAEAQLANGKNNIISLQYRDSVIRVHIFINERQYFLGNDFHYRLGGISKGGNGDDNILVDKVAFAGLGMSSENYRGINVDDKAVLLIDGLLKEDESSSTSWLQKVKIAEEFKARAILIVDDKAVKAKPGYKRSYPYSESIGSIKHPNIYFISSEMGCDLLGKNIAEVKKFVFEQGVGFKPFLISKKLRVELIKQKVKVSDTQIKSVPNDRISSGGVLHSLQMFMDIRRYNISLNVIPFDKSIDGFADIDFILAKSQDTLLFNLLNTFDVEYASVNGKEVEFVHKGNFVYVLSRRYIKKGKNTVRIKYRGKPLEAKNPPHEGGFVWACDKAGNPWVSIACQFEGGKVYFPCKDHPSDEPDEGAELHITVPNDLIVAGPGLLERVTHEGNLSTYHWNTNYTINNYSIVFTAGKFQVAKNTYTTIDGNKVPMEAYLLQEHEDKGKGLLDRLKKYCHVLEKYFGEYPWVKEKIGVCETPFLGMEHQTMIAYGNFGRGGFYKTGYEYDNLLYHEFSHEWWGNKITCNDWADMWIHEGIGTYAQSLYTREVAGKEEYDKIGKYIGWNLERPLIEGKDLDIVSIYDGNIYYRGADFMRLLNYIIGDSIFFSGLKKISLNPVLSYQQRISTIDIINAFSNEYKRDVKPLFDLLLTTTDKIKIIIGQSWPRHLDEKTYYIKFDKLNMSLPFDVLTDKGIQKVEISNNWIEIKSKTLPIVDPDGRYPKKVVYDF